MSSKGSWNLRSIFANHRHHHPTVAVVLLIMVSMIMSCAKAWSSSLSVRRRTVPMFHRQLSCARTNTILPPSTTTTTLSFSRASYFSTKVYNSHRRTSKKNSFLALESAAHGADDNDTQEKMDNNHPKDNNNSDGFRSGDKVQVEIISFGPLGASVDVIAKGHAAEDIIDDASLPLAKGLIYQREISYFREWRNHVDVVRGEVLPAYVDAVRDDGKLDIGLRSYGGKAKAEEVGQMILDRLQENGDGQLPIGDKSLPEDIASELPGVSKISFKKAVAALYKQGLVQPGPDSIKLLPQNNVTAKAGTAAAPPQPPNGKQPQQQKQQAPPRSKAKDDSSKLPNFKLSKQADGKRPPRNSNSGRPSSSSPSTRKKSNSSTTNSTKY